MNLNPLGDSEEITSYGFSAINYNQDPFLAKYDATGNLEWYQNPVESGDSYGSSIATGSSESVIWTGFYDGYMQFEYNGGTVTYPDAPIFDFDSFIFEVDSDGEIVKHMRVAGDVLTVSKGTYDSDGNFM